MNTMTTEQNRSDKFTSESADSPKGRQPIGQEKKLIDIMFQVAFELHRNADHFKDKPFTEVADWVSMQLQETGFHTAPVGASWGLLYKVEER